MKSPLTITAIVSLFFVFSPEAACQTEVSGEVQGDWTLEGSPYIATDTLTVPDGEVLTVQPGVEVRFEDIFPFFVFGRITAEGTEEDSIMFAPQNGGEGWGGLRLIDVDDVSIFKYCIFTEGRALQGENFDDSTGSGGNIFISGGEIRIEHSRISYGRASAFGGGIGILRSSPEIDNTVFAANAAIESGGAIGCRFGGSPTISNCLFVENSTEIGGENEQSGGAIYIALGSNPIIENCHFQANHTALNQDSRGGAIAIWAESNPEIRYSTFYQNAAPAGGAIYIRGNEITPLIEWCDFIDNRARDIERVGGGIYMRDNSQPEIRYCRFIGNGADNGGAFYIKQSPDCNIHHCLFTINTTIDGGSAIATSRFDRQGEFLLRILNCTFIRNYHAGGGESEVNTAMIAGNWSLVMSNCIIADEEPYFDGPTLEDLEISYCHLVDSVDVLADIESLTYGDPKFYSGDTTWAALAGNSPCRDSGNPDLPGDPDETIGDRGWLYYPSNALDGLEQEVLTAESWTDSTTLVQLNYTNETGIPVYLSPMDNWIETPREILMNVTGLTGDQEIHGVAWTPDGFFVTGGNNGNDPNKIYHLDENFNLRGQFDQPGGHDGDGYMGLASDGRSVLFGGDDRQITEFTTSGEFGESYRGPGDFGYYSSLGADFWNLENDVEFYLGNDDGVIARTDAVFREQDRIEIGDSLSGLGVKWNSRALYLVTRPEPGLHMLSLLLPEEDKLIPLYELEGMEGYNLGGIEITQNWEVGRGSLVAVINGSEEFGDRIFVENIYTSWLVIVPEIKLVKPGETVSWEILFAGNQVPQGRYESQIYLTVNDWGENNEIPVEMLNHFVSVTSGPECLLPVSSGLASVFPNPFNDRTKFTYYVARPGHTNIALYSASGRLSATLTDARLDVGYYSGSLNAGPMPAGRYFLRLTAPDRSTVQPVVLIK